MKSQFIYTILIVFAVFTFVFTGCTNGLTQKLDKKNDSSKIVVEGSIKLPSAIPSAVRSAYSSYTDYYNSTENQTSQVIMEITATATINGTDQEESSPIQNNTFTLYLPKEDADWTFEVKCCDGATNQIIMSNSTTKTIQATDNHVSLDPFVLTYTPDTIGIGQINLPFKATDSSITKLKFELKDGDVEIFTGQYREFYNSLAYLDIGRDVPVSQGTYDLYISFIDTEGMIYGPIVETISVVTNFTTDTWFGSDSFIKQTTDEYNSPITAFVVPSATQLKTMFPNYTYSQAVTGDVALMWDYDPVTYKPSYTVHPVDSGIVSDVGYPLALGKDIRDVFPDYSNNDMYVLTNENAIYKYTASSGYSEYKVNYETDFYILSACANGGVTYALCFDGEAKYMSPETQFILYKFDNTDNYMTEIGYVPLTYADFPDDTDTFKMATCDNYIFIAYNYGNDEGFCCDVFTPNKMEGYNLINCWSNGELDHYYNDITEFKNKVFRLNDIIAIHNDIGSMKPDLYVLLGCTTIRKGMMPGMSDSGYSYGGIIKIQTTMPADNIYNYALDTDYGYRYLYKYIDTEPSSLYCNDSPENFYNPIKFIGKNNEDYIIADDGAIIQDGQGKNGFTITNAQNVNRLVTVNLTSSTANAFIAQDVNANFDNNAVDSVCYNYRIFASNGQQMPSGDIFAYINNGQNISTNNTILVRMKLLDENGYLEPAMTLPSIKNEPLYLIPEPFIPNAEYNGILYCNGKDINEGTTESNRYYSIDKDNGTLRLHRALPVMGNTYKLALDIIEKVDNNTQIHNSCTLDVTPATEFDINYFVWDKFTSVDDLISCLDNFLIADVAVITTNINDNCTVLPDEFVNTVTTYFKEHPCINLTLDYSEMTDLSEITAGMFGLNCSRIILPVKKYSGSIVPSIIKKGAFISGTKYTGFEYFEGDLVLHKSIETIESGAFGIPPRSIVINDEYYNASGNQSDGKFAMMDATQCAYGTDMLMYQGGNEWSRIITCTKRDEPFVLNLTAWNKLNSIDDNAFKGLPIYLPLDSLTFTPIPLDLGTTKIVGHSAFEGTSVSEITGMSLEKIGYKAFPYFGEGMQMLTLKSLENNENWFEAEISDWDKSFSEMKENNLLEQLSGTTITEKSEIILKEINDIDYNGLISNSTYNLFVIKGEMY